MDNNVCLFVPHNKDNHSIHIINFVLETKKHIYTTLKNESVYKMYYVTEGGGFLHTVGQIIPVSEGDIFFTFPSHPFAIESGDSFKFMYISFIGSRASEIMDNLEISHKNFVFKDFKSAGSFWKESLASAVYTPDLTSQSILFYTFSLLGNRLLSDKNTIKENNTVALMTKKYIDDNFSDTDLSLEKIAKVLSYNAKYISSVFKKEFNIGVIDYLTTIRIQNSCTMIQQGFTIVCDIALRCGYIDGQYFSKVFKGRMGISPTQYIKEVNANKKRAY